MRNGCLPFAQFHCSGPIRIESEIGITCLTSMAVFIQKTKFSSRRKFRLKYLFVYQYKHGKNASDGRILRRKFRLNLCVETTHKLKQFSRLNYKGEILSVPYLYRRKFRLNKIPTDLFVLWFIQSKFSAKTKFSSSV